MILKQNGSFNVEEAKLQRKEEQQTLQNISAYFDSFMKHNIAQFKKQISQVPIVAIDLCFLVDCTASMQLWINTIHKEICKVIESFKGFAMRVGFVGYRDRSELGHLATYIPFRSSVAQFISEIQSVVAFGGDDMAEDVLAGIMVVANTNYIQWSSPIKIIVHIADAPCHGASFHNLGIYCDRYHFENPSSLFQHWFNVLVQYGVKNYFFLKINDSTDTMINRFKSMYNGTLTVHNIGGDTRKFADLVIQSISQSLVKL